MPQLSKRSKILWAGVALALVVVSVWTVRRFWGSGSDYRLPKNPYGLSSAQQKKLLNFFGVAAGRGDYQISALTLHRWLAPGRPVLLLDVRQPLGTKGYAAGYLPGAVNIPLQWFGLELTTDRSYSKQISFQTSLGTKTVAIKFFPLPKRERIVVMCYDGNGGEMTPVLLRLLGYRAYGLRYGVSSWNPALNVWPAPGSYSNLPLTSSPQKTVLQAPMTGSYQLPANLKDSLSAFFSRLNHPYETGYAFPWTITPSALYADINGPNPPQVVDVRSPAHYAQEHIPGSLNIPYPMLGSNIRRLNPAKPIVLVSNYLQKAAEANAILRLMGYHSYVLKKGLVRWNASVAPQIAPMQYPLVKGSL